MKNQISAHFSFLFILFLGINNSNAQVNIKGLVKDTNGPLPFANVLLLQPADSSLVRGAVTNDDGTFIIENVKGGSYLLSAFMVGFENSYQPIDVPSTGQFAAGEIMLAENVSQLEAVTVTAKKPLFEQKIDRLTVNVANSITAAGATALEVLERSPGVVVDRQQGGIFLSGKDGVIVMMNGKINRMPIKAVVQLLEGMPSDNIEKIELITTPPANFDAEGNAGFINIVLKQTNDRGLNGSFNLSAGYGRGTTSAGSLNFNYRKGAVNLFGDYSFRRRTQEQIFTNYRRVMIGGQVVETNTTTNRKPIRTNHNARLGMDVELGEKTVLGLLASGYNNNWIMDAVNPSYTAYDGVADTMLVLNNSEESEWKHISGNGNLQHTFAEGEVLTFDVDYLRYIHKNPTNYLNTYSDMEGRFLFEEKTFSGKETPIKVGVGKLDYRKKLSGNWKMEIGAKATVSRFDNWVVVSQYDNGVEVTNPELTAKYRLGESIGAAYTAIDGRLDKNTTVKFGLRYEYTDSNLGTEEEANIVDRQYSNFFPSLFLSRKINEEQSANFSYSRRITRPTFNNLAPFIIFFDPNTYYSGNPALQPAISNNVKLDYRFKTALFSLQYTHEDSAIVRHQVALVPGTNIQTIGAANMQNRKTATLTVSFPIDVTDRWRMQHNINGNWQEINTFINGMPVQVQSKYFNVTWINSFKLSKKFSAELVGFYRSKQLFGTAAALPTGALNFGLQKKLDNNGGSLRFGVDDVFNSKKWRMDNDHPNQNFVIYTTADFSQRTFKVSYSRSFGNRKLKGQRKRKTGAEEERKRVD